MALKHIEEAPGGEITAPTVDMILDVTNLTQDYWLRIMNLLTIFLPEGHLFNGKINVTVTTNNLKLEILTASGGTPSSTDPVFVKINGIIRKITAATSVTKNAGTNWGNAGSVETATKEIDWFPYAIWNTGPATDVVDVGFSRIPYGSVYSDFSATTTNEKYLAYGNGTAPAATDDVTVIGRFAATLSGTAAFNWSVPTYTSANLKQYPVFETGWLAWTPTHSRTGTNYTNLPSTNLAVYKFTGENFLFKEVHTQNATPGGTGDQQFTLPFTSTNVSVTPSRNVTDFYLMAAGTSFTSNLCLLKKYDGTTDVTASKQYDAFGVIKTR